MNSINEIAAQNLMDCWSILYKNLAKTIIKEKGNDGKIVVRRANHLCGITMGESERKRHHDNGQLTNLKTFFKDSPASFPDPRFRIQWQLFNEQEAVFDVITCPIYDKLEETGEQDLMLPFCEEYHLGCIEGYTRHTGQCCLSENFIYPGENSCRLGCYFRASNMDKEFRSSCFSEAPAEASAPSDNESFCDDPKAVYSHWAKLLLDAYITECTSRYGSQSVCIIAEALKAAAAETSEYLIYRSSCTNQKLDKTYIADNTFWGIDVESIPDMSDDKKTMIDINYSRILNHLLHTHCR